MAGPQAAGRRAALPSAHVAHVQVCGPDAASCAQAQSLLASAREQLYGLSARASAIDPAPSKSTDVWTRPGKLLYGNQYSLAALPPRCPLPSESCSDDDVTLLFSTWTAWRHQCVRREQPSHLLVSRLRHSFVLPACRPTPSANDQQRRSAANRTLDTAAERPGCTAANELFISRQWPSMRMCHLFAASPLTDVQ